MLKYSIPALSAAAAAALALKQTAVDAEATHEEKVSKATSLFASKTSAAFNEIRSKLSAVAPSGEACFYCERDRYRDIEHIRPKRHYPEQAFKWENYLYACAICNQDRKKDTYAVFDANNNVVKFDRTLSYAAPVPAGDHVLIDLRVEDPLEFLMLDLMTGDFVPIGSDVNKKRGDFTRSLFDLNNSALASIRRAAFNAFKDYLLRYKNHIANNQLADADKVLSELKLLNSPTVLVEMRRQAAMSPALAQLFDGIPVEIGQRPA